MSNHSDGYFRARDLEVGEYVICLNKRYRYSHLMADGSILFIHSPSDFFFARQEDSFYVDSAVETVTGKAGIYKRSGDHFVFTSFDGLELLMTREELPETIRPQFD